MSHEFIILADTGESEVFCHRDWLSVDAVPADVDYEADLQPIVDACIARYAATDEKHDPVACPVPEADLVRTRGIEVGHIFYFGTKYSAPMGAKVAGPDGKEVTVHMGSYGVGISRLVAGIIEASHDDAGIVWPEPVAPFKVGLVNLKVGDAGCDAAAEDLYGKLGRAGVETLLDDRDDRPGPKLANMDLIGLPWQMVVGPRGLANGVVEVKNRKTGERVEMTPEAALNRLSG